jgi:arylsulfatase A-like enzyme
MLWPRKGTAFTAASSTYPVCDPFRFSLITGDYAHAGDTGNLGQGFCRPFMWTRIGAVDWRRPGDRDRR